MEVILLITGTAIGFVVAVVQRTYDARQKCYVEAVRLAAQYMNSDAFTIVGRGGTAPRPTSMEINKIFAELLLYSRFNSNVPEKFLNFFCQNDATRVMNELWPELLKSIRSELWMIFKPKIPNNLHFRWHDEL